MPFMTKPAKSLSEAKQLNARVRREIMRSNPPETDVFYTEVKSESVASWPRSSSFLESDMVPTISNL